MHSYLALAAALLASAAFAAPAAQPAGGPQSPPAPSYVTATLMGATPEDQTTITIPVTSTFQFTHFGSSVSHIQTSGGPCAFFGVDGLVLEIQGAEFQDVGPPQTIVGAACGPKPWPA